MDADNKPYLELGAQPLENGSSLEAMQIKKKILVVLGLFNKSILLRNDSALGVWQIVVTLDTNEESPIINSGKQFVAEFSVQNPKEIPTILVFDNLVDLAENETRRYSTDIIGTKEKPNKNNQK